MKHMYYVAGKVCQRFLFILLLAFTITVNAQVPTTNTIGNCSGVVANFNTNDNGFNSPSIYGSIFDSSFYYHSGRGYWTDYLPPFRTTAPGFPRVLNIISPPFSNPNPNGTFNVGFYYIINNPNVDRFQVRIISVTTTPQGTVTNVEATSGTQFFSQWSTPSPYVDGVTPTSTPVPDPTPLMNGWEGYVCIRLVDPDIQNGPNTTFRVEVSYLVNGATFAVFDNLSIGPLTIPLPVNFIGLVANRGQNKSVDLKWDVSEEVDVREYQIERSSNGISFENKGSVPARGKTIYNFTDLNVSSNTVFYRIKSVDLNGTTKYSGIMKLPGNSSNTFGETVTVYPVPATDDITIQHQRLTRKAKIEISSAEGKVYRTISPAEGASHTPVNISNLAPGMYFIRLDEGKGDGYGKAIKIIKN